MKKSLVATLALLIFLPSQAGEVVKVSTLEWPPYTSALTDKFNESNILVKKIFKQVNVKAEFNFYPWSRALMLASNGLVDALGPEYYSEARSKDFYYSEPFYETPLVLVARKDFPLDSYKELSFLTKYKIGVVKNYINNEYIDDNNTITKENALDDLNNIKKLIAKRIDVIVIDKKVMDYLIEKEGLGHDFKVLEPILERKKLYVVFPKKKKGSLELRDKFNAGLRKLQLSDRGAHP
ncbi:ABC transporter substrate-binding protein [Bacteriovorax sp. Seq25_V]|uniref:substrate-binding periplasmic protein n=1 Tax=Bacteriovorax sp. Seq25_V TaxID=1201288 RepID=UPI00038A29BC|nr:transporter substrate-binding domain-containing protein [Bacteriovorax sp. Seq25_V]EQC46873.1 ABC transporter, substrate-binding protein, family 3 [Bacteriovorax sp. Seq25_V]